MSKKIVWRVQPKPTGRYRSFQKRGWPQAFLNDAEGSLIAALHADEDYPAPKQEIRVVVYDHRKGMQERKSAQLKQRAKSVDHAKRLVQEFYNKNPEWLPVS